MHSFNLVTGLVLFSCVSSTIAAEPEPFPIIPKEVAPPPGYQKGFATQDFEPPGQKSICQSNCGLPGDNAGNGLMREGVFAAAIGPEMGGEPHDCFPCGSCYAIRNSGNPYCQVGDPNCPQVVRCRGWSGDGMTNWLRRKGIPVGPDNQVGLQEIKVMIVNHCDNCRDVPGHFDINESPGWDNPMIWWKALPDSECRK